MQRVVARLHHQKTVRQTVSTVPALSGKLVTEIIGLSAGFLARGTFFALIQILEAIVLMRTHYFYLPASSLGILAVVSVAHTAALVVALSLRRTCTEVSSMRRVPWIPEAAITTSVLKRVVGVFFAIALILATCTVLFTGIHFSSPPIYRAMVMGWIAGLPLECAIILGLYSARVRLVVLPRYWMVGCIIGEALFGVFAIAMNLPLLYLISRVGFLCGALMILFPIKRKVEISVKDRQVAEPIVRRAVFMLLVRGTGPALFELSAKLLYLPFVVVDPTLGITLLISHRLMHLASAFALRLVNVVSRTVRRVLVYGSRRQRLVTTGRVFCTLMISAASTLCLLPVFFARFQVTAWISPYNEWVEPSLGVLLMFSALLVVRAAVLGFLTLLEDHFVYAGSIWRPSLFVGTATLMLVLLAVKGSTVLGNSFTVTTLSPFSLMVCELIALLSVLAGILAVCLYVRPLDWSDTGIRALAGNSHCKVSVLRVAKECVRALDHLAHEIPSARMVRFDRTTLLASGVPDSWKVPAPFLPFIEASSERLPEALLRIAPRARLQAEAPEKVRLLMVHADAVARCEVDNLAGYPSVETVSFVSVAAVVGGGSTSRQEELSEYLDILIANGGILSLRAIPRHLKGILHINQGAAPRFLVIVGAPGRVYLPELAYALLQYNLRQADLIPT